MNSRSPQSRDAARQFVDSASFIWHQRFDLAAGVQAPGSHDIEYLFEVGDVPEDLTGKTILDVGTANGGAAFICERRGARRVVALDIYPPDWFGFSVIRDFLGSQVRYLQATVYELRRALSGEQFDLILFWGVLYHLRHPLLALDEVRAALAEAGDVSIETAVCDEELRELADVAVARFYRRDELAGDGSNWFAPSTACLRDWCRSSGLDPRKIHVWGEGPGKRCIVLASKTRGDPEFLDVSYEVPLHVAREPLHAARDVDSQGTRS
jgi:tRNA (mo5U34)-methyltransferase